MNPEAKNPNEIDPKNPPEGFSALLNQNQIAEAQKKAETKIESLENRIRKEAPIRPSTVVKTIRTYKGDVEEGIARGNTTMVSIASAQARAQGMGKGTNVIVSTLIGQGAKKVILYFLGFLLLVFGAGGVYYIYMLQKNSSIVTIPPESSLIFIEKTKQIDTTGKSGDVFRKELLAMRDDTTTALGSIIGALPTKKVTDEEGVVTTVEVPTDEFFKLIKSGAPGRLIRSLSSRFLFGVHVFDGNQSFVLFEVTSYETAFAGMLEWEKVMEKDLGGLIRPDNDFKVTGTSTEALSVRTFEDIVYKNTDARALKDKEGKILIVYSFPTQDSLIVTTNTKTLGEIIDRLTSRRIVR